MLSLGMLEARAVVTAVRRRGLALMSPPPIRAATVISLIILVKILPRLASFAAFLCLIELHFEWPDMRTLSPSGITGRRALSRSAGANAESRERRSRLDGYPVCYHSAPPQVNAAGVAAQPPTVDKSR